MFDPVLLQIGPLAIRWYGLMYAISFGGMFWYIARTRKLPLTPSERENLWLYAVLGVLLGGRIGYVLFYNLSYYFANPLKIFAVWEGGMSFHGGMLGVIFGVLFLCKRTKKSFLKVIDVLIVPIPLTLFLGRIGNFINGELYGRIATDQKWCLTFPTDPANCRYPSQLFEAFGEGLLLFGFLFFMQKKIKTPGVLSALFLAGYGVIRFSLEFLREPDSQIGYYFGWLTQGQILSSLMVLAALIAIPILRKFHRVRE